MNLKNQTNVLAAFEMLLEEVENEVELVNKAGGRAMTEGNYPRAEEALQQGRKLTGFRDEVAKLRRQWRELVAEFDVEAGEDEETRAQRRDLGRLKRGVRTAEEAFRIPILRALDEMGGSGKTAEVLDRVGKMMKGTLGEVDFEPLPSTPDTQRWRNTAQWSRNTMVNEGLLRDDSPRGTWELSDAGRQVLTDAED